MRQKILSLLLLNLLLDSIICNVRIHYRKRKKELTKESIKVKNLESSTKKNSMTKSKAKDSDDEDYMAWKKPDVNAPIVTFTPPPDDAIPASSLRYKSNILTKNQLDSFNVRQNVVNIPRAIFADGDDGFESLNGYNSNCSDMENRIKISPQVQIVQNGQKAEDNIKEPSVSTVKPNTTPKHLNNAEYCEGLKNSPDDKMKKEDNEKSLDIDSDAMNPNTSSPSAGKRIGVRFRSSWVPDTRQESSDDNRQKVNTNILIKHVLNTYIITIP